MAKTYFTIATTLEELKQEYKRLAMLHHPDLGGDTETMKAINNEYSARFKVLKERDILDKFWADWEADAEKDKFWADDLEEEMWDYGDPDEISEYYRYLDGIGLVPHV